ncbi:PREDICTED: fatty acid 2-hydroxylase [Polistes dominula]|uniref:Fatty acid 2-hydroxylase n=1 Tax=Polistes dominula TaxID=743375 RepID=A0ABM1IVK9_POLDO|nr:PREDICTED: fatty acid 2-hydroxylase [Polistes dominula]
MTVMGELKQTYNNNLLQSSYVKLRHVNKFQNINLNDSINVVDDKTLQRYDNHLTSDNNNIYVIKQKQEEEEEEEEEKKVEDEDRFIVKYQGRNFDIRAFLNHHPGGKKTLSYYKDKHLDQVLKDYPHSKAALYLFDEYALDNKMKYSELESLIDWDAPLLNQVGNLSDKYWEWVNLPVNRPIRLFRSNVLEFLTITPWYLIPIVWIPVCLFFLYMGINSILDHQFPIVSLLKGLVAFGAGVLLWTFEEYLLHRKLFHYRPPQNSKTLITLHFLLHGLHHKAPFDGQRLVFPPIAGIIIAIGIWNLYVMIFPDFIAYFIAAGTTAGYLCYDLTHYYLHYGAPNNKTYLYNLKRYHNYHHFSHHDKGFGISSRIWDYAFNTTIRLQQLVKPIEW